MTDGAVAGPAVAVSDLTAEYPARGAAAHHVALRGISLRVERGEILGLLGDSGAGKSSLLRLIAGTAEAPRFAGGDLLVGGTSLRRGSKRRRLRALAGVGYVPQGAGASLEPSQTVAQAIAASLEGSGVPASARGERTAIMLEAVGLPLGFAERYPYELSSGERQRVALAASLVTAPSLLLADEPSSGLDVTVREAFVGLLERLRTVDGFSALIVSHDERILRTLTDRVAVLHAGALAGLGTLDDLLENPGHPYVERLAETLHTGDEDGGLDEGEERRS